MPHNQYEYWNDPKTAESLRSRQSGVTEFAQEAEVTLPRRARILELGCGAGDDAGYFASKGHIVTAIDFSEPLVHLAAQRFANEEDLTFVMRDVQKPFDVSGQSLDCVYSRLSLHYFSHDDTMRVFGEIAWVLRPGGRFFFACRSIEDPLYGKGEQIEEDMYLFEGHVRHFFSTEYAYDLLTWNGFEVIDVRAGKQKLYGEQAGYVRASAVKP